MNAERPPPLRRILQRLKRIFTSGGNATANRLRRRQAVVSLFARHLPRLLVALLAIGYLWLLMLPSPMLGRGTYIDENALQPSQVTTYWNWEDVHAADKYLESVEFLRDSNATSLQRAQFFMDEFSKLGLSSATQKYHFVPGLSTQETSGANAYAILDSPRGPHNEAIVIGASWLSRTGEGDGTLNLRGVSTVLALARFLRKYSLWAKDIIFVISDGYLDGMHAWLSTYHGASQTNLVAAPLDLVSGVIWTALNIDYPGHSFSHLGLYFEGINGRLPNQDLLNSVERISRYTGQVPVTIYDHLGWRDPSVSPAEFEFLPVSLRRKPKVKEFVYRAKNILRHVGYQARGKPSGVHGLYHQFRVDAITVFAMPATGPHGFHALGRVIESSLRTMNNLLERLHASFFFFILTAPDQFMKIGSYLPGVILISVAMMFRGLRCWVDAGWKTDRPQNRGSDLSPKVWSRRSRPVLQALSVMLAAHMLGIALFFIVKSSWLLDNQEYNAPLVISVFAVASSMSLLIPSPYGQDTAPLWQVLKAFNLCFASAVISAITVINFSLAALLAVTMGLPLSLSSPAYSKSARWLKYNLYVVLALGWLLLHRERQDAIWHWEILSVWFAPFICIIYTPLVIQAGIVCILSP